MSDLPTTPLKFPMQGNPVDTRGNWTPAWFQSLQQLYNRVGTDSAPSNTQLADAISSAVQGPSVSVPGDIALFEGTSGTLLEDSGVQLSSLAPLASPSFTGTPTAPTPVSGDSSTEIATTAFVSPLYQRSTPLVLTDAPTILVNASTHWDFYVTLSGNRTLAAPTGLVDGAFLNFAIHQDSTGSRTLAYDPIYSFGPAGAPTLTTTPSAVDYLVGYYDAASGKVLTVFPQKSGGGSGTPANFSAHNNGVAQAIPNNTLTKLSLSTTDYNVGSYFSSSRWTPPAGPVVIAGAVFFSVSALNTEMLATIYKNGVEFKRGVTMVSGGTVAGSVNVACMDVASGSDYYELWTYQTTGSTQNTNGTSYLTWFQGSTIPAGGSGGSGNVTGPSSSTNNDIALFNGTTGALIKDSGVQLSSLASASAIVLPNLIINGGFTVNQRNVLASVTLSASNYWLDRWKAGGSGCVCSYSATGNVNTVSITVGTLLQIVEGLNIRSSSYTISWSGTAQCRVNSGSYFSSPLTISLTGGSNTTIEFGLGTVSAVQMSAGASASTFSDIGYSLELIRCQRYFWRPSTTNQSGVWSMLGPATWTSATTAVVIMSLPQVMRIVPTLLIEGSASNLTIYSTTLGTYWALTALSLVTPTNTQCLCFSATTSGGGVAGAGGYFEATNGNGIQVVAEL